MPWWSNVIAAAICVAVAWWIHRDLAYKEMPRWYRVFGWVVTVGAFASAVVNLIIALH